MNLRKTTYYLFSLTLVSVLLGCVSQPVVTEAQVTPPAPPVCPVAPAAPATPEVVYVTVPKECPPPKPVKKVVCPTPAKPEEPKKPDFTVVGRNENIYIEEFKLNIPAKLDSGAKLSSINAQNLTMFERDGKKWVRFSIINPKTNKLQPVELPYKREKKIKQLSGIKQERTVVTLTIQMGPVKEHVDVTLSDRTGYEFQFLVGRTFMEGRFLIDVSKEFTTGK